MSTSGGSFSWDRFAAISGGEGSFEASRWHGCRRYWYGGLAVTAIQMEDDFEVTDGPHPGKAAAGDWLVENEAGACWPVSKENFASYFAPDKAQLSIDG